VDNRAKVQDALKEAGIPTAVHYPIPLNEQPAYKALSSGPQTPFAAAVAQRVLSLPMGPDLGEQVQLKIVDVLAGTRAA
jgi:UDP-2-acetamido-2-deoxy-ribo-hexuluronate aminotransferase